MRATPASAAIMGGTLAAALLTGAAWAQATPPRSAPDADAAQVRQAMIRASIAGYPGNCPCPYSTMRNGRNCGSRSAYSKPGGAAPLCYPRDISDAMVEQYRKGR